MSRCRKRLQVCFSFVALIALLLNGKLAAAQGFRDFRYISRTGGNGRPTGEKPESKLWYHDGRWWAILARFSGSCNPPTAATGAYTINYLDGAAWTDTKKAVDNRCNSRADVLSDGATLYVVSHLFVNEGGGGGQPQVPADRGRFYRFSYDSTLRKYNLDAGFPVEVTGGNSETLVLAKDSEGHLWVTYVESNHVMVNYSLNNGVTWNAPFVLPGSADLEPSHAGEGSDDIASIIAYDGRVGIMWSHQTSNNVTEPTGDPSLHSGGQDCSNSSKANPAKCDPRTAADTDHLASITMNFAVHDDDNSDPSAWTNEVIYAASGDDHINLKYHDGHVYAGFKEAGLAKQIGLLVCDSKATSCARKPDWKHYTVYRTSDNNGTSDAADLLALSYPNPTRPVLLIDSGNNELYVFVSVEQFKVSTINYKKTKLDAIEFDEKDAGVKFIATSPEVKIDDPTSTKQTVDSTTGLVVLACDRDTRFYLHNFLALP